MKKSISTNHFHLKNKIYATNNDSRSLCLSLTIHAFLFVALVINVNFDSNIKPRALNNNVSNLNQPDIIKAVVVDQKLINKEIARLDNIEKMEREKKLQEKLLEEKKLKEIEEEKQKHLAELNKIKQQKELEKKELALAKQKQEKQKLAELKLQKELEQKEQKEKAQNELKQQKLAQAQKKAQEAKKIEKQKQDLANRMLEQQQEDLLARLKKEQEQKMQNALLSEEQSLAQSRQRLSIRQREIEKYISMQQAKVSRSWISRESFMGKNLTAKLEISLARDGRVVRATIIKSSGDEALDISAKNAILKASPLPVPEDDELFKTFVNYNFTFKPDELS